ncbi:AAA family ATPase [Ohessyouella blattaphilus]|uniref:Cytidylate kinase-like family protein n=1 Tax=Ohessyouella blattaphilus TaxID=2949333 RepID=A0ABT1EID3_9FIRM|nr:cytidylate kinase-like family protein [Ohessyouella blattaphilus]MCP1110443.1 cytidylate kinase-like family protein [Ohessyouella blattaphilus]MCR8563837.1 cytidylate kinase-like family protein [Ohessyouella blattaphilus]
MNIITVSREFGSGGRELGKSLAEHLGIAYYDKEILHTIAEELKMDEGYISRKMNSGYSRSVPVSFGKTFAGLNQVEDTVKILVEQQKILKELAAKGEDFVIIGRNADVILQEYEPFKIFVYAEMESKIRRCQKLGKDMNELTDKEMKKQILRVDKGRKKNREIITSAVWGDKENYQLCINTSDVQIKTIVPATAEYIKGWRGN